MERSIGKTAAGRSEEGPFRRHGFVTNSSSVIQFVI
jgi:hypothetical protein